MFSRGITDSDSFLDMPAESQMLYMHLNMAADDDGFCDNPRSVMRKCGAGSDAMKILIARKFVLSFEKQDRLIVVIKHWRMNNYIRRDTYRETRYRELMRELYFDENQAYSTNPGDGHRRCVPAGAPVALPSRTRDGAATQERRGESQDRKEEGREGENRSDSFFRQFEKEEDRGGEKAADAFPGPARETYEPPEWVLRTRERIRRSGLLYEPGGVEGEGGKMRENT